MEGVEQEASVEKSGSLAELTVVQSVALDGFTEDEGSLQPDLNFPHIAEDTTWLMVQESVSTSSELQELGSALGEEGESKETVDNPCVPNGEEAEKDKQQNISATVTTSTCPGKQLINSKPCHLNKELFCFQIISSICSNVLLFKHIL